VREQQKEIGPFGPIRFRLRQESLGEPLSCFQVSIPSGIDLVVKPSGAGYAHALVSSDLSQLYASPKERQATNRRGRCLHSDPIAQLLAQIQVDARRRAAAIYRQVNR
jgi:hypothetical protein